MSDRSDEIAEEVSLRSGDVTERLAVVASSDQTPASERVRSSPGAPLTGSTRPVFERHSVFLAEEAVVFLFEGSGIEGLVRHLVNDPTRSATFSVWGPSSKGRPSLRVRRSSLGSGLAQ